MIPDDTAAAFHALAVERRYSGTAVDRWQKLAPADAVAILDLASGLRLGENQLRDLWEWAEEIAARDQQSLAQVLTADTIAVARRRSVSRNDRLKLVKEALRRMRFPQLVRQEERLQAQVSALALPRTVRIIFPEFLEGDGLRIEIAATGLAELRSAAAALLAAADSATCGRIFEELEGLTDTPSLAREP